jgi:hypothetical protein
VQDGKLTPMPFADILDPKTGRMRVRMVNTASDRFRVAGAFMTRLRARDLTDPGTLSALVGTTKLTPEAFASEFDSVAL